MVAAREWVSPNESIRYTCGGEGMSGIELYIGVTNSSPGDNYGAKAKYLIIPRRALVRGACFYTDIKNVHLTERMGLFRYWDKILNTIAWWKYNRFSGEWR